MTIIDKAAIMALTVHEGHINKHNGEPYVCHLYRVASAAQAAGEDERIVAALWLHDSIEDLKTTYDAIVNTVNREVANIVLALSKINGMSNERYYASLLSNAMAARAKHYDLLDNFSRNYLLDDDEKRLRMAHKYSMGLDVLKEFAPGKTYEKVS